MYRVANPAKTTMVITLFGGAAYTRIWHTTIMWVFLSFTVVHVYLVYTEDVRLVKAMLTGYYYRNVPDRPGS